MLSRRPARTGLARGLLLLAGIVLPVVLLEVGLQVASLLLEPRRPLANSPAERHVLCVGDSHTWGVYYEERFSYPNRLQAYLDHSGAASRIEVVTEARPGWSTAPMLARLPELLQHYQPEVVLLLGGLNNRWNRGERELLGERRSKFASWLDHFRVWTLLRMALAAQARPSEHEVGAVPEDSSPDRTILTEAQLEAEVAADVRRMVQLCRAGGSTPIVLTYAAPDPPLQAPNRGLRAAAAAEGVRCIDLESVFARRMVDAPYETLLIPSDFHPRPAGYEEMARAIAGVVIPLLRPTARLPDTAPPVAGPRAFIQLQIDPGRPGDLVLVGPEGAPFRVYFSLGTEPPLRLPRVTLPLEADALFRASEKMPELAGNLDATGNGRLVLDPKLLEKSQLEGQEVYCAAVLLRPDSADAHGRPLAEAVSERRTLRFSAGPTGLDGRQAAPRERPPEDQGK